MDLKLQHHQNPLKGLLKLELLGLTLGASDSVGGGGSEVGLEDLQF